MKKLLSIGFLSIALLQGFGQSHRVADRTDIPGPLTPRPIAVTGTSNPVMSLNGTWSFSIDKGEAKDIQVPGEWEMQGFNVKEGETAHYKRALQIPADWQGQRVKLRFDGVCSYARVKVNNVVVGSHEGGFVPFEVDITKALKASDNILDVEVQARTVSDILACTSQYAVHTVGGILRDVQLMAVPEVHIEDIQISTRFDANFRNATLEVRTSLSDPNRTAGNDLSIAYTLRDKNNKTVLEQRLPSSRSNPQFSIKAVNQWNPESPYLYQLTVTLFKGKELLESIKQKVGFRQVQVSEGRLLVNGRPVKLHGVNRHSVHPITGRSITKALDIKDAVLFREANCNYVRTSHYPPTEAFLNACDSLGLFVEDESSLCWIQHHASRIWQKWNYEDERFLPVMLRANLEKVMAARNHPCVIMWSLGNESRWSSLWQRVNDAVKQADPSRPTVFHDQCWGGFNNAGSKADIANYHYPGINGARACDTMKRPVLFGEYAHVTTYSRRELLTDPGVRGGYGEPLRQMYDSMYYHERCLGGAIWSGIDDTFHLPDGNIVGYGPWGIIDAWRRKKPEFYGVKRAYSPVRVIRADLSSLSKGYVTLRLENRYDFSSLKDVIITSMTDAGKSQVIKSIIPPHGAGDIKLPVDRNAQLLTVSFKDPRGFNAFQESIPLKKMDLPELQAALPGEVTENEGSIVVNMGDLQYRLSKSTGIISEVKRHHQVLMNEGPQIAIIPMNSEDGNKPNVAGETYQNNIYPLKGYPLYTIFAKDIKVNKAGDSVSIQVTNAYSDGNSAEISYVFRGNSMKVSYTLLYKGEEMRPYQYGMLSKLPKTMDELCWNSQDGYYDQQSNGHTLRRARLNAKNTQAVEEWRKEPTHSWGNDANELGSNDFRSTKRRFFMASISDQQNNKVTVLGNGEQASRSWLQDGQIQWLIADYCNAGSEPFYGSPFTDGRLNIKGKTLRGTVAYRF